MNLAQLKNAETSYFYSLQRGKIDSALDKNQKYYEKLFELYKSLGNYEDKFEIACELEHLCKQARFLKNIQLNKPEETA